MLFLALGVLYAQTGTTRTTVTLTGSTGTISGFVKDSTNSESLSFVNVFVQGTTRGAATNRDGYYVITGVPRDTVTVVASIIGYKLARQAVDLRERPSARLDFRLVPAVLMGEEVTITAQRQRFRQSVEVSTVTLDTRDIQVAPAFVEADVFRTLQLLPGVQSVSDYSSAMYVRGSTPDQNLILLDGITVYSPFHLGGIFSTFNTDAIKEAEFIAGGFSAKYGGRMGSVLEIINRDGNAEEFSGKVNISLISSKALLEGPLPKIGPVKGSWMVAGRRTYFDTIINGGIWVYKQLHPELDIPEGAKFPYYFYDVQGKVNLDIGNRHRLILSTFRGRDILYVAEEYSHTWDNEYVDPAWPVKEEYQNHFSLDWSWGNTTNSLTWRWIPTPKIISKLYLATSRFRYGIGVEEGSRHERVWSNDSTSVTGYLYKMDLYDLVEDKTVRGELTWLPSERHTVVAGTEQKWLHFNLGWLLEQSMTADTVTQTRTDTMIWIQHQPMEQAYYLEDKWQLSSLLIVKGGLRVSRYSLHDTYNLEPRLGGKFFIQSDWALTAAWGRYYQYLTTANPSDENLRIIDLWLPAPPDKPAPYSEHFIAGLEHLTYNNTLFKAETYYKTFENLLYLKEGYLFFQDPEDSGQLSEAFSEFYSAKGRAWGLELLVKKNAGRVRGWLGYTLANTRWWTEPLGWYAPNYDRAHTLNLVADWQISKQWHFSTAFSLATGNPYTPVIARYQPFRWSPMRGIQGMDPINADWTTMLVGEKNSVRYPVYRRLDIGLVRRKPWRKGGYKEFYIQVMNVTNHLNVFQYFYRNKTEYVEVRDPDGGIYRELKDLGIERLAIPMFPFFPTFGVRYEF